MGYRELLVQLLPATQLSSQLMVQWKLLMKQPSMVKFQTGAPPVAHPAPPPVLPHPPAAQAVLAVAMVVATAATPKSTTRLACAIVAHPPLPHALAVLVHVVVPVQAAASHRPKIQSR